LRLLKRENRALSSVPYFKPILRNGFINQAGNLAHTLSNRFNFYIIGNALLIGVFARASSLIESVWLVSASITPLLLTRVANQQNDDSNSRLAFLLSKISLLLSALCVIIMLSLPDSLYIFLLGSDFAGIKELMLYLSPGVVCIGFSTVISHYFSGTGEQKVQLLANSAGLLVTLCTAPLLISRYQLNGACYAASLSYFVQALVLTVVFMRRNGLHFSVLFRFRKDWELLKK
jgi:O-antigen/teichoic acid export membrane protein